MAAALHPLRDTAYLADIRNLPRHPTPPQYVWMAARESVPVALQLIESILLALFTREQELGKWKLTSSGMGAWGVAVSSLTPGLCEHRVGVGEEIQTSDGELDSLLTSPPILRGYV